VEGLAFFPFLMRLLEFFSDLLFRVLSSFPLLFFFLFARGLISLTTFGKERR